MPTIRVHGWRHLVGLEEHLPNVFVRSAEDCGHDLVHPASVVSFLYFKVYPLLAYSRKMSKLPYLFFQGWTKRAERIQSPAPLPEDPAIPLLTKMLVPVPYQALKK